MLRTDSRRRALLAATAACALPCSGWAGGDDIVVGQIGPFTGTPVPGAAQMRQGIEAALGETNAAGGIGGRRLALFALDDGFDPDVFVRRFAEAAERRPVALLAPMGTPTVQRMLDARLLDRYDMLVLNAVPGADSLRSPGHPRLLHVRAGDHQQVERIVRHAVTLGITQMAVLCQDLSIGTTSLAVARQVADAHGVRLAVAMAPADGSALDEAVGRVQAGQPQCVLVLGSPRFAARGIAALRRANQEWPLYALGYVTPELVVHLAGSGARGVALAQVFPNPNGNTLALQQRFQAAMAQQGAASPFTPFQLEGYVTGRVLVEGLRRAKAPGPEGLAHALHAMGECNLGGFRVDFSHGNVGSHFVDIAMINSRGRLVY